MSSDPSNTALSPYRVLDLTRVRSGPTCVRQLADWGADVIKIEEPGGDDAGGMGGPRAGPDFQNLQRNKRALTLNLKSAEGVEVFKQLAARSDVVVENFRPGVKSRLGIDYDSLKPLNKGLIYASISGFGQDGPYRDRPGFDQIAQGMGGLMSITGKPGHPSVDAQCEVLLHRLGGTIVLHAGQEPIAVQTDFVQRLEDGLLVRGAERDFVVEVVSLFRQAFNVRILRLYVQKNCKHEV